MYKMTDIEKVLNFQSCSIEIEGYFDELLNDFRESIQVSKAKCSFAAHLEQFQYSLTVTSRLAILKNDISRNGFSFVQEQEQIIYVRVYINAMFQTYLLTVSMYSDTKLKRYIILQSKF